MKEDSSLRNKMIDGNWILKRKRKRSTSGSDPTKLNEGTSLLSDSPKNIPSVERKLEDDINASRFHHKHYFECVECDLGGNLLCCDSCPRTYHLECLTPPLKRTPPGKWQCPKCCEHKDYFKTINNAVENPKRARSKSTSEKPKTRDKASFSGTRHHFQEENKLNYKGKIIFPEKNSDLTQVGTSHSTRSSHSCDSGSRDGGISTPADRKIEKKPGLKRCRRKISLNSDPSGKFCDEKGDTHKSEMKGKNKLILSLVRSTQKSKKKSQKVRRREKKRSRTEKGKLAANTILNHTSKEASPTPENKGFLQKRKSFDQLIPGPISKEESRIRKHSGQKLSKISLEGGSPSSHGLDEQGVEVDKSVDYHENLLDGDQQVDRILGCRVQSSSMMSSCHTETIKFDTSSRAVDIGDAECKVMISTTISSKDQCVINGNCEVVEGCAINAVDTGERPVSCDIGGINAPTVGNLPDMNNDDTLPTESGPTERKRNSVVYEFLVKWVGKSNIHDRWVSESELKVLAKRKLDNYMAKYGTAVLNICEEQWCEPQRVIALHVAQGGKEEALVKWRGLPYDESTWERLDEPVIRNSAHLITQFKQFESQTLDKDISRVDQEFVTLMEQPKELQGGSLFPHQLEALNWLRKCWFKSKNVILADEMGLGKTVSAAAFISSLYCEFKARLPCLVLVPLSTMPNWLAEFALWAPCVNVVEYHGSAKARSVIRKYEWQKFNVLLTSYEMVLADSSHLRAVSWEVLVVDEGHRLKNSGSKLFGLLNSFSFQHRVLMTGTPLQNNIGEMYNLLNFLQPISFPSLSAFEEKFTDLTTAEKVEELKKLVAPHMLRRLKKDAMQNIPPKTERIVPVELTSIQAEYYRAMLTKNYQILRNVGKGGVMQSMLNIVMQLRKVCNHPYLIPGTEPESGSVQFLQEMRIKASAKLTLLHSMLKVLRKDGHRVLIFSQMTKLLDILEDYLTIEFGPKTFERVDGSVAVADRQSAIARFNQDKTRFVFLLSTRSCGLGINLATADTVIIYDSDFNPHADIQAMNRAHRIGQSNVLLVYRLVVRASVEERILQLAKKKLMLDQLFVNKSESQKDVEDILRWGTEELFSECDNGVGGKDPTESGTVADGEQKHRRRAGGLGDVYEDRFTDDCTKIIWDENAILKLLDRSNIPSVVSESTDVDLDNDMLGSVKSMDWNDDLNEEPGGNELLPGIAGNGCEQPSEAKEENTIIGTEENEWDRLLRIRWEKYQTEAEAVLGRGKRLRKAISYKETFASIPSDALTEPCGNEEVEAEPEYTPAGRALKEKFAKLRSRQKERLTQRHITDVISLTERPIPSVKEWEGSNGSKLVQDTAEHASAINSEDTKFNKSFEARNLNESIAKPGRFSKYGSKRYHSSHVDQSLKPPGNFSPDKFLPNHQFQSTLLPVLGLCAPNANQVNSASRKLYALSSQPIPNHEPRRTNGTSEFPFPPTASVGPSSDMNIKGRDTSANESLMPVASGEPLHRRQQNFAPGSYFPFCPPLPIASGRGLLNSLDRSGASFSSFMEKLVLPDLAHEYIKPQPVIVDPSLMKPHTDLLPSLSLSPNMEYMNRSPQDLPNVPILPNFRQQPIEALKQKQPMGELPPILDLSQLQATHSGSLPENHKKVLDNIMMRTRFATDKIVKKRPKADAWSEEELDALWIGVRRHGRGNWDAMLRDPKLKFSRHRTSGDLSTRWPEEQCKLVDGPAALASPNSASFLGISDGMMTRALLGSKFSSLGAEPPKFRSHLTDIQLGRGDRTPGFPLVEPTNHFSAVNDSCSPLPAWEPDKFRASFTGDVITGPFDMLDKLKLPLDQPLQQHTPLPGSTFASLNKNIKAKAIGVDDVGSSKANKLPHWLREAVSDPPSRPAGPDLPPTVSAIAHSVRVLYGEDKPTIPPFTIPGPPPCQPKDPRKSLKKKNKAKLHGLRQASTEIANPIQNSVPPESPLMAAAPSHSVNDPNIIFPSLHLNLNSPSSPSFSPQVNQSDTTLVLSPEVVRSVASCMASVPCKSADPDEPSPSCQRIQLPASQELETLELDRKGEIGDLKGIRGKRKASQNSLLGDWGKLANDRGADSGESSKTLPNPCHAGQVETKEISSEEIVSIEHQNEQGP